MAKNKDRYFEALDIKKKQRAKLTPKQYLVYSYLVSISKWNANKAEQHYYTYKNSYVFNDFKAACEWIDKHDDERYEIVPQKFGHEFVNYWD